MQTDNFYQLISSSRWSVILSVLLHGLLLAGLLSLVPRPLDAPEPDQRIKVDIIPFSALQSQKVLPKATAPAIHTNKSSDSKAGAMQKNATAPTKPIQPKVKDGMIRPTTMLSASSLARKGNKEAREDFAGLSGDEQREQLCALEALEQIEAWDKSYKPERMVSYTFADVRYEGRRIIADGAAFWSHDNWHHLKFDCELSDDLSKVLSFAFLVGVIVPKRDWEQYNLTKYK